jgi:DNA polymerase
MAKIHIIDFESYWAADYTLSKMTTEEYVRDQRFRAHLVGMMETDGTRVLHREWVKHEYIQEALDKRELHKHGVVAHHAQFDGLILNHHYNIRPKVWFDTLSMARPIDGWFTRISLAKLCEYNGLPPKGDDTANTKGIRYLGDQSLHRHGAYCLEDCDRTFSLFKKYIQHFNKVELHTIDSVIRMFTEPVLRLNAGILEQELEDLRAMKMNLLIDAGITVEELMSADKFAAALRDIGVRSGMKMNKKGDALIFAFAKTDPFMQDLLEHPDPKVQVLAAARLGIKSTIAETRAQRMLEMSTRGTACVYLNYWGALQTGRHSGGDKMNWQNPPRGGAIRAAVESAQGQMIAVGDLSQIEFRVLVALAGQWDAVARMSAYDRGEGEDPYCFLASRIYKRHITVEDLIERQLGKIATLGLGYGMGWVTFVTTCRAFGVVIKQSIGEAAVEVYRTTYDKVPKLWSRAQRAVENMMNKNLKPYALDDKGMVWVEHEAIRLPNGMYLRYPNLHTITIKGKIQHVFVLPNNRVKYLYGGKLVENIIQAIARIIMMEATARVSPHYLIRLHSHDELGVVVNEGEEAEAKQIITSEMTRQLKWWPTLPINTKVGFGHNYRDAK